MFKVFVSYSTYDLKNVEQLQQSLQGSGVEVFVAEHSIAPSETLAAKISTAISGCDLFVLLWSENARASEWVPQEIGKAHSLNKPILPLVLTEGLNLPAFINNLKYLPVFKEPHWAMAEAQKFIIAQYLQKQQAAKKKELDDMRGMLVLGGLALWLFSQK
jgi:hypothetical protein